MSIPSQKYNPFPLGAIIGPALQNLGTIVNTNAVFPVSITVTAHGLTAGTRVRIASVTGQTALNAEWIIGVTDANTITIPLAGNGVSSGSGTLGAFALSLTSNHPELANLGSVGYVSIQALPGNTGNIYVGVAATMKRLTPFTDVLYILKPGVIQTIPAHSQGSSGETVSLDGWGIDWDTVGEGCIINAFLK